MKNQNYSHLKTSLFPSVSRFIKEGLNQEPSIMPQYIQRRDFSHFEEVISSLTMYGQGFEFSKNHCIIIIQQLEITAGQSAFRKNNSACITNLTALFAYNIRNSFNKMFKNNSLYSLIKVDSQVISEILSKGFDTRLGTCRWDNITRTHLSIPCCDSQKVCT